MLPENQANDFTEDVEMIVSILLDLICICFHDFFHNIFNLNQINL